MVCNYGSGSGRTSRSVESPLPTTTTKARFGIVVPTTHSDRSNRARSADEPLPTITTANRGELTFIAAQFGERHGQEPRVHSIADPAPTICAQGRVNLLEPADEGPHIDILFRMLEPHELAAAMSFSDQEATYEFTGTKTDIIRQIGNANPIRMISALVTALLAPAAAPRRRAV